MLGVSVIVVNNRLMLTAVAKIALVAIFRTEKEALFLLLFKLLLYLQHEERIK